MPQKRKSSNPLPKIRFGRIPPPPPPPTCDHPGCTRHGAFGYGRSHLRNVRGWVFCREHRHLGEGVEL